MRSRQSILWSKYPSEQAKVRRRSFPILRIMLLFLLLFFTQRQVRGALRTPQAVLVLGGSTEREIFAADFARQNPDLPVWVSSGSNPEYTEWVFVEAGIDLDRIYLDYQAVDTVTNFTTLVDRFQAEGIRSIYLITSDYHMRRARFIGEIVLGSRGIHFRPVVVPSEQPPESLDKALRDAARSVLWVVTGHTGSTLSRFIESED